MKSKSEQKKLAGLPAVKIGDKVRFTGKGGAPTNKPWLRPGMVLTVAANKFYVFHGHPLLYCKVVRGKKEVGSTCRRPTWRSSDDVDAAAARPRRAPDCSESQRERGERRGE